VGPCHQSGFDTQQHAKDCIFSKKKKTKLDYGTYTAFSLIQNGSKSAEAWSWLLTPIQCRW